MSMHETTLGFVFCAQTHQLAEGSERSRLLNVELAISFDTAEHSSAVSFTSFLSFALFQLMSETLGKRRTFDRRGVGFSPAGDLLRWGTNPPITRRNLSSTSLRATEPTDASGCP